ncbi:MAG: hypothetical protein R6V75_09160 [Bacteroidales bacterium]
MNRTIFKSGWFPMLLALLLPIDLRPQSETGILDPDSLITLLMENGEWEELSLHPEILDELMASGRERMMADSLHPWPGAAGRKSTGRIRVQQALSIGFPSTAGNADPPSGWQDLITGSAPLPFSARYRIKVQDPRRFEARFLADQDALEPLRGSPLPGLPDHLSAGIRVQPGGIFKDLILGDFQANFGLGAILASTPAFTATPGDPSLLNRPGTGIRLHPGTDENRHFRGAAIRMLKGPLEIQLFISGKRVDASLDTLPGEAGEPPRVLVDHLYGTGYHRSAAEIRGRESLQERAAGMLLKIKGLNYETGLVATGFRYAFPMVRQDKWEAVFAEQTDAWSRAGGWFQWRVPVGILFAEVAWSPGRGSPALLAGFRMFTISAFTTSLRISYIPPSFPLWYTVHQSGNLFTRGSVEVTGLYRYAPTSRFEMNGYLTSRRDLWPGSNRKYPYPASKASQQVKLRVGEAVLLTGMLVAAQSSDLENQPEVLIIKIQVDSDPFQASPLRLRAGIQNQRQWSDQQVVSGTTGDASCYASLAGGRFRAIAGFRVFQVTQGMDPLYAYEPDLLYGWSAPVMSGSGSRWFLTLRWRVLRQLVMEGKVGRTSYTDARHRTDAKAGGWSAKFQLVWTLDAQSLQSF